MYETLKTKGEMYETLKTKGEMYETFKTKDEMYETLTLTHAALFGVLLHVASLQSLALEKA